MATLETLRELISPNYDTGDLYWKPRLPVWFTDGRVSAELRCALWNSRFAGALALHSLSNRGYRNGSVLGENLLAHRVLWGLASNRWPVGELDHINGIRDDNRLVNLREVTRRQNSQNQKLRSTNRSGVIGVRWVPQHGFWYAAIGNRHIGVFKDFDAACEARRVAERNQGYHPNHGRRK